MAWATPVTVGIAVRIMRPITILSLFLRLSVVSQGHFVAATNGSLHAHAQRGNEGSKKAVALSAVIAVNSPAPAEVRQNWSPL